MSWKLAGEKHFMEKDEALEALYHMGKAWFILRYVYEHVDNSETRWQNVPTANSVRESYYTHTTAWHDFFLTEVLKDSGNRMRSDKMKVTVDEVKTLAQRAILLKLSK